MKDLETHDEPWTRSWPEDGLESVPQCPVCGGVDRGILYSDLVDNVFRVAQGKWTLYQCQACQSAYLDPRPTPATIGRAYTTYFTHKAIQERENAIHLGRLRLIRRAFANGYTNWRYGTKYSPSTGLGKVLASVFPSQRAALDIQFRWLPKPSAGHRLLDIGCGNGAFLVKAREAGWQVVGVDPDPVAIKTTRQLGLETYIGSIDVFEKQAGLFDAITLSHVIEHLHDPQAALNAVYRLLKEGGTLYLDTPNIQSDGFLYFGKNWRGIESPRHLVLFSIAGIGQLLQCCGFRNVDFKYRWSVTRDMFMSSLKLSHEYSLNETTPATLPFNLMLKARLLKKKVSQLEFITLSARK